LFSLQYWYLGRVRHAHYYNRATSNPPYNSTLYTLLCGSLFRQYPTQAMSLKAELEVWAAALKAYDEEDFERSLDLFLVRASFLLSRSPMTLYDPT
jgi:hypothetical protein